MTIPICPVHQSPMKASQKGGGFFCSRKVGEGYCTERAAGAAAPVNTYTAPAAPSPGASAASLTALSLQFAAQVYQGTADGQGALDLANMTLERWRDA